MVYSDEIFTIRCESFHSEVKISILCLSTCGMGMLNTSEAVVFIEVRTLLPILICFGLQLYRSLILMYMQVYSDL